MSFPPEDVLEHVSEIEDARASLGYSEADHPTEFYLALMHVESHGDELPDETDSYRYWWQIGQTYLQDAREYAGRKSASKAERYALEKIPSRFERLFEAGPYVNALVTMLYMQRYRGYHDFNPYRMAGLHKGGAGTAKQVTKAIRRGMGVEEAHRWVAMNWYRKDKATGEPTRPMIPRLYIYVYGKDFDGADRGEYRFTDAWRDYSRWADDHLEALIDELHGGHDRPGGVPSGMAAEVAESQACNPDTPNPTPPAYGPFAGLMGWLANIATRGA